MIEVRLYDIGEVARHRLKYVVIVAQQGGQWIVVRHRDRDTWELPGGHIENSETIDQAAARELYEETGAVDYVLEPICIYSVSRDGGAESYGQLYFADVQELGSLPDSEICEIRLVDEPIEELTYPQIQPVLWKRVLLRR